MTGKFAAVLVLAWSVAAGALAAPRETEIQLAHRGAIQGTLALAEGSVPAPLVLLIAGSGPTDRNGNNPSMHNNSLQGLAHALAAHGIASVRYDKRGVAGSRAAGPSEVELTLDGYADDAAAWLRLLGQDARFSKIVIVGHSEGSLIGMLAARRGRADGFVSLAGPGDKLSVVLRRQLAGKLPPDLMNESERILIELEQGRLAGKVPPLLSALYRPSVQPYLVSAFKYDPAQEFRKLTVPAAVFQGSTDLQASVDDARRLQQARPGTPLVIVTGMNHVLKVVEGDMLAQMASYTAADLPVSGELVAGLVRFIGSVAPR
ncbi:MAG: alpha/beta hydrolase [Telluria sp.]